MLVSALAIDWLTLDSDTYKKKQRKKEKLKKKPDRAPIFVYVFSFSPFKQLVGEHPYFCQPLVNVVRLL